MANNYIFTSESVSEGHPDKVADQISDAMLDAILIQDPHPERARVACETLIKTGAVVVAGEISTEAWIDLQRGTTLRTATHTRHGRSKETTETVHFDWDTHLVHVSEHKRHKERLCTIVLDFGPDVYDTFHSSQVPPPGLNHAFYSNPKVDSLLELGRVEFDQGKRAAIYHEAHRLIALDQPYTFVNTVPEKRPISKRIGNVVVSPDGPFNFYPGAIYWFVKDDLVEDKK